MHFQICGEYKIPITEGRRIDRTAIADFWGKINRGKPGLSEAIGCYVFGVKSSGSTSTRPWYVGKTLNSFRNECFQPTKIIYYEDALHEYERGYAKLFLIPKCTMQGRYSHGKSTTEIDFLEKYLIGIALKNNPGLLNKRDTIMYRDLYVPALINPMMGNPGASAQMLRRSLGA